MEWDNFKQIIQKIGKRVKENLEESRKNPITYKETGLRGFIWALWITFTIFIAIISFSTGAVATEYVPYSFVWPIFPIIFSVVYLITKKKIPGLLAPSQIITGSSVICLLLMLLIIGIGPVFTGKHQPNKFAKPVPQVQPQQPSLPIVQRPKYQEIYVLSGIRYDGGTNVFVLIDPVNPADGKFKEQIQNIINVMVQEKGPKTSIDIFDDRRALEVTYQEYARQKPRSQSDEALLDIHYVAGFSGDLDTDVYKNTLSYYLAATTDDPKVGRYVATVEFNPVPVQVEASVKPQVANTPVYKDMQVEAEKKSRQKFDNALAEMQENGFIMQLRPEVNTVLINPMAWVQSDYTEKELTVQFFSQYCRYYCAIQGPIVHVKDGYSGRELAGYGAFGVKIKE